MLHVHGQAWTILHTAERAYLAAAAVLHPEITAEHAREEWPELLAHIHLVRRERETGIEVWRADGEFDRVYLVVEPIAGGYRVCDVRPAHQAQPGDTIARRGRAAVHGPAPSSTPAPPEVNPVADSIAPAELLALLVHLEPWRHGEPFPGYRELGRLTGLPRTKLEAAVTSLEQYPGAPAPRSTPPWLVGARPAPRVRSAAPTPTAPREVRRAKPSSAKLAARLTALGLQIAAWEVRYGLNPEEREGARAWATARERGEQVPVPLSLRRYRP